MAGTKSPDMGQREKPSSSHDCSCGVYSSIDLSNSEPVQTGMWDTPSIPIAAQQDKRDDARTTIERSLT
jgi:hypothetical protein